MPYKSFVIPAFHGGWAVRELNAFISNHRVLTVDRQWVDRGENSFWAVWVDYLDSPAGGEPSTERSKRVDYKEILSPEDFEVFAQLRTLRKEIATEDGVQLYAVFTNEQLAQIVQQRVMSKEQLARIAGVGETRVKKYGPRILKLLSTTWRADHEKGGGTVPEDRAT